MREEQDVEEEEVEEEEVVEEEEEVEEDVKGDRGGGGGGPAAAASGGRRASRGRRCSYLLPPSLGPGHPGGSGWLQQHPVSPRALGVWPSSPLSWLPPREPI